jgi:phenylalanyl-tRNA synthetase beta chain
MKVPLSWLGEYFFEPLEAFEVAERLTLAGIEVEQVQAIGLVDPRVVVAEVRAIEPIAGGSARLLTLQADRLRSVVTTLAEVEVGQRVALALPGATLFDGAEPALLEIEPGELYGKLSEGALASAAALGAGSDATRPLEIEGGIPGKPLAEQLAVPADSRADRVLQLSIVPNIARCQSLLGVAREVRAILGRAAKPEAELRAPSAERRLEPSIEAGDACTSLSVFLIEDVEVKPSPPRIQQRLVLAGMSPINNVVDASNYVMLELGQPTHPYDADRLPSLDLGVRRSRAGDRLHTLQQGGADAPLELPPGIPLIVSNDEPVAVAGVVGGRPTSIGPGTRRVLLESAAFELSAIRKSQQALRASTEASARFSRGVNPELPPQAAARFLEVLRETSPKLRLVAAGERSLGLPPPRRITLSERTLDQSLGVSLGLSNAAECLRRVGLEVTIDGDTLVATAGNARQDVTLPCDLIEEIARLSGYDRIPETMPTDPIPEHAPEPLIVAREALRDAFVRSGLTEVITYSLTSLEVDARLGLARPEAERPAPIPILNPASADRSVLRTSLLPGLLEVAALNLRLASSLRLFEIGPVFLPSSGSLPDERERAAFLIAGSSAEPSLYDREPRRADFFDAKVALESALSSLGLSRTLELEPADELALRPGASARVICGGRVAGNLGAIHPLVLRAFDLEAQAVFAAELELEVLLAGAGARVAYAEFDRLPSIDIDIACIVENGVSAAAIRAAARESAGALLREVEIFDVFRGPQIGENKKAIALRLRLNAGDRTLEMSEALAVRAAVAGALREELGATIRE